MKKKQLVNKLHWFYSLELNQVDLYYAQYKNFKNSYSGLVFERAAYIEQDHVDNIAEKIKELGATPTKLGDVISPILGKLLGIGLSNAGLIDTLKANIYLENKAMKDYQKLIKKLKQSNEYYDNELIELLQFNHIDEDLHTAWLQRELRRKY